MASPRWRLCFLCWCRGYFLGRASGFTTSRKIVEQLAGVLGILATVASIYFVIRKPQTRFPRYRLGAEICRSLVATGSYRRLIAIFRGILGEYRQFVRMLLNFRRLEGPSAAEAERPGANNDSWRDLISHYRHDRIKKQIDYYRREQSKARRRLNIFKPAIFVLAAANLFVWLGVQIARGAGTFPAGEQGEHLHQFIQFLKVALPLVTGALIAILAIREAPRRKGRYGEMLEILQENAARLDAAGHRQAACEVVIDNELALIAETLEWVNTTKYSSDN